MRQKRMRAPEEWSSAYYHCISRVVGREFLLGDKEKDCFVKLMRKYERFCCLKVVSYCVMDNHFHLLVEEPPGGAIEMSDSQFLAHLKPCVSQFEYADTRQKLLAWRKYEDQTVADELKASYLKRMGNVSFFMKGLKQEFTQWFNRTHKRSGTLWESRFKSVLINGMDAEALTMMSAYIDLNPVRAGIVEDPKNYRWCGYGEACAGKTLAREGIRQVMNTLHALRGKNSAGLKRCLVGYELELMIRGQSEGVSSMGNPLRKGVSEQRIRAVLNKRSKLSKQEALLCKVRYFCDGAVIGSQTSVDEVFESQRWRFGPKRPSGARKIRCLNMSGLYTLRDLQIDLIG
ncbi:MAG: transposase [Verrucomicrobiota bacterium]